MYVLLKGKANYGKMNLHTPMCVFKTLVPVRGGRFFVLYVLHSLFVVIGYINNNDFIVIIWNEIHIVFFIYFRRFIYK